jgi:hypothetical protein
VEALERLVEVHAGYSPRIDALVRILEAHQYQNPAVSAALRDRLDFGERSSPAVPPRVTWPRADRRHSLDLFFAVTLPSPRRERTGPCGWPTSQNAERMSQLLRRALINQR